MVFHEKLKTLRLNAKLNQKKTAEKLNVASTTYNGYEHGRREPDFDTLKKIANFFDCSIDYLLDNSPEKKVAAGYDDSLGNEELAKRIKLRRESLNMTQDELSEFLNVRKELIIDFENGNVLPSVNRLKNLSVILRTTSDYLIGNSNEASIYNKLFLSRLKDIMIKEGVTKDILAKKIMINHETMNKYLDGVLAPDTETIKRMSKALNTTADYLVGLNDNGDPNEIVMLEDWIEVEDGTDVKKIPASAIRDFLNEVSKKNNK